MGKNRVVEVHIGAEMPNGLSAKAITKHVGYMLVPEDAERCDAYRTTFVGKPDMPFFFHVGVRDIGTPPRGWQYEGYLFIQDTFAHMLPKLTGFIPLDAAAVPDTFPARAMRSWHP